MRIDPIFGFLGSGKTTLLRRILAERGAGTAVIVNEFGDVGIDGAVLEGDTVDVVQMTSGCLCCTLKAPLIAALADLAGRPGVARTVIEATGIAQPDDMADTFAALEGASVGPFVTVVDAARFTRLRQALGPFYEAQVAHADVVLLNKIDLAEIETIEAARRQVAAIAPGASVIASLHCDVELGLVLDGPTRGGAAPAPEHDHQHGDAGHGHFDSFVLDAAGGVSRAGLEGFFAALPDTVHRAKGFMSVDGAPCLVQFSPGQLDIEAATGGGAARLVVIGRPLDRPAIEAGFAGAKP